MNAPVFKPYSPNLETNTNTNQGPIEMTTNISPKATKVIRYQAPETEVTFTTTHKTTIRYIKCYNLDRFYWKDGNTSVSMFANIYESKSSGDIESSWLALRAMYRISLNKKGYWQVVLNGRLAHGKWLGYFFRILCVHNELERLLRAMGHELGVPFPKSYGEYMVSRNPRLKDLGLEDWYLMQLYNTTSGRAVRPRVLAKLRANDTKGALDAFHGCVIPKALKRYLRERGYPGTNGNPAEVATKVYPLLEVCGGDVSKTIQLMELRDKVWMSVGATVILAQHFNHKSLLDEAKKAEQNVPQNFFGYAGGILDDIASMIDQATAMDLEVTRVGRETLKQFHDRLSVDLARAREARQSARYEAYKAPFTCDLVEHGNVRNVKTTWELQDIGNQMGICVGSYMDMHHNRDLDICVLERDGVYVACLEVKDGALVQAKLKYNSKVLTDPEVNAEVLAWAKVNKLKVATNDVAR